MSPGLKLQAPIRYADSRTIGFVFTAGLDRTAGIVVEPVLPGSADIAQAGFRHLRPIRLPKRPYGHAFVEDRKRGRLQIPRADGSRESSGEHRKRRAPGPGEKPYSRRRQRER